MKQHQLFNPNVAHLGRIAALRARVAEARRAFPDFDRYVGPLLDVPECSCDECDDAADLAAQVPDDDRDLHYTRYDSPRDVEFLADYIVEHYDVCDAWVDWNHDRTHYFVIVVPHYSFAELRFNDAQMALHHVHANFGDHLDHPCYCVDCYGEAF